MRKTLIAVVLILGILSGMWAVAVRAQGAPSFSITPLQLSFGSSEPEIAFNGGFMAITSLSWLLPNGTQLWTGDFGATPNLQGAIDSALKKAGFTVVKPAFFKALSMAPCRFGVAPKSPVHSCVPLGSNHDNEVIAMKPPLNAISGSLLPKDNCKGVMEKLGAPCARTATAHIPERMPKISTTAISVLRIV